jgi:hypothetical protein
MIDRRLRRRWPLATVLASVALALAAGPATAGTPPPPPPDSTTGNVGAFGWEADTEASPAGRCRYGFTVGETYYNHLNRVGTDAPEAYARPSRTTQRIGFRVSAQRLDGARWINEKHSSWSIKTATPSDPAPFRARGLNLPLDTGSSSARRAKVQLRWYGRDADTVVGTATMFPDWYEATERGTTHSQDEFCGGTTG